MKKYRVISPFVDKSTGNRPQVGDVVEIDALEGERLKKALCVIEIETEMMSPPENRQVIEMTNKKRGRPKKYA